MLHFTVKLMPFSCSFQMCFERSLSCLWCQRGNEFVWLLFQDFMKVGGWLDFVLISSGRLLGFLKGENFPVTKLEGTSKKSASKRLLAIVIDSLSFLNKAMIFFFFFSNTCPLLPLIAASPSSLYSTTANSMDLFKRFPETDG